ncbi:MAG: DNA-binding response regulator [Ruminococcaceae bacterium]|nr:DNA-binding response regulator [Oscillospiraceae bacterium]
MRILFCDDNLDVLTQLQDYVAEYFAHVGGFTPEYEAYTSGELLLKNEKSADIVFLDVQMPGLNGIHVGAELKKRNPACKIFIVTSYPDYLDEAMKFQVFRYLSKPIDKNRLFRNLKDAVYQYAMGNREYPVLTETGMVVLRSDEIVCVEVVRRKCFVHTTRGVFVSNETMEYWKKTLTLACFYATHKSFIINMRYVCEIQKDVVLLRYQDKEKEAYLAMRKFAQFKDTYLFYLGSVQ